MRLALASLALVAASSAFAAPRESATFTNVDSAIASNAGLVTAFLTGGYTAKYITISGTLSSLESGTHAREAAIQVFPPSGNSFIIQPAQGLGFSTQTVGPVSFPIPVAVSSAPGTWSFRCIETYDDGVRNTADARWTELNIQLNDGPPAAKDLGALTTAGRHINAGTFSATQVKWYRISLDSPVTVAGGTFLDIDTLASVGDTEIGLFTADGTLVASDDDDGPNVTSQLTFGAGTRPSAGGNGLAYNGRDGELPAGTYYISLSEFDSTFVNGWGVTSVGSGMGETHLNIRTNAGDTQCPADVDDGSGSGTTDGGVTIDDLLYYLQRFTEGC